jgi:uncharacterized repeat protein (TIGR01451 family)
MVFSLVGLVMTVFLAIGQVGLIAASADGWNDRSGGSSSTRDAGSSDVIKVQSDAAAPRNDGGKGNVSAGPVVNNLAIVSNQVDAFEGILAGTTNWVTSNLCAGNGICYKELENVPERALFKNLTSGTVYTFTVLVDAFDGAGHPGFSNINSPQAVSGATGLSMVQNANVACGGGSCLSYTFTFTASAANAEIRWNAQLALGAHLFGGSSLSSQLAEANKTLPLPVNDILLDIRAHKFNDLNGNGTQDAGEPDLAGWTMTLYSGPSCAGNPVDVTGNAGTDPNPGVTDANGNVDWTNLSRSDGDKDGRFSVQETLQGGWTNTTPLCQEVTISGGANQAIFGNQRLASNLTITKSADVTTIGPNGLFTYTVTVTNTGNGQATGVVITDDLPNSLIPQSATFDVDPGTAGGTGTCDIATGDIVHCPGAGQGTITLGASNPNNQSDTVVVTIQVKTGNTCRVLHNTASVDWAENPSAGTPVSSNRVDVTVTGCSIAISKVASTVSPTAGSQFIYTILAESLDIQPVTNVTITDTIPANLSIVSATYDVNPGAAGGTGNCSVSGQDVSCSVGTLAGYDTTTGDGPDAVKVIITVQAPNTCVQIDNKAAVQWTENGTNPPVESNTATVTVTGCAPSLTLAKTGGDVAYGQDITWTITVTNNGNADATNVAISDTLPAGFTFVSSNPGSPTCTEAGGVVSCNLGTIAGGQSTTVDITATAPDTCGPYTNTVTGTFGTEQTIPQATGSGDVTGCSPGLTLHKTGPGSVATGGNVAYTVTVGNTGNADSANVTVTDSVDADLTNVQATPSQGSCSVVGNAVSCDLGIIPAGGSATISISGTVPTGTCPAITNQAFIGELGSEIVTTTVTGCTTPPPPPTPGIQIVKGGPDTAHVGDTITYTFDVSLISGSPSLTNVSVTDPICDAGTLAGPTGDDGDSVLEQGETWGYTCTHVVTSSDPDPLPNTATVEGHSGGTTVTDDDSHEVDIVHPAIRIQKQARPQAGSPGDEITYTYTVTNTGDVTLFDISVDDDVIGHICDIASLAPGDSKECTATYTIPEDSPAHIRNVAVAEGHDEWGVQVRDDDTQVIDFVLGQTITPTPTKTPPGGTAFTGSSELIPLSVVALMLLTAGTALLWVGRRRSRQATTR